MIIIFDIFKAALEAAENLYNFLFTPVDILGYEFIPFSLLAGGLFAVFFVLWLIKKLGG